MPMEPLLTLSRLMQQVLLPECQQLLQGVLLLALSQLQQHALLLASAQKGLFAVVVRSAKAPAMNFMPKLCLSKESRKHQP